MKNEKKLMIRKYAWAMLVAGPVLIAVLAYIVMSLICFTFTKNVQQTSYVIECISGMMGIVSFPLMAYWIMKRA